MTVKDAILNRRTIRKFKQEKIEEEILMQLIDFARLAPTGMNLQPLKFAVIAEENTLAKVFPFVKWASYLSDGAPKEGEKPVAYIAILGDYSIKKEFQTDAGSAVMSIITGAMEYGLGSCWLGALNRDEIMSVLGLSQEEFSLLYLVALGYPNQESIAEETEEQNIRYWKDEYEKIHVPKRSRQEVVLLKR